MRGAGNGGLVKGCRSVCVLYLKRWRGVEAARRVGLRGVFDLEGVPRGVLSRGLFSFVAAPPPTSSRRPRTIRLGVDMRCLGRAPLGALHAYHTRVNSHARGGVGCVDTPRGR